MTGIFLLIEKVDEQNSRITQAAQPGDLATYAQMLNQQGQAFIYVPVDGHQGYVKTSGDGSYEFADRPPFAGTWDKEQIEPGGTATLSGVPACTIRVVGNNVVYEVPHPGGDLPLTILLPGVYAVEFEVFPTQAYRHTLLVGAAPQQDAAAGVAA